MEHKSRFMASLSGVYEEIELHSMWRILIEDKLNDEGFESLDAIIEQLQRFKPIQYITGLQYFYDKKFIVNRNVLIPRSETEELVDWVLTDESHEDKTVLDLGTGCGCIAIILKSKRENWEVHGMDISKEALKTAEKNGIGLSTEVTWHLGDMLKLESYPTKADVIVCNPPYVLTSDYYMMAKSTIDFEPGLALYVDNHNPLKYYQAVIENTKVNDATYYFEIHHLLGDEMRLLCQEQGLTNVEIRKDMQGKDRMLKAQN